MFCTLYPATSSFHSPHSCSEIFFWESLPRFLKLRQGHSCGSIPEYVQPKVEAPTVEEILNMTTKLYEKKKGQEHKLKIQFWEEEKLSKFLKNSDNTHLQKKGQASPLK